MTKSNLLKTGIAGLAGFLILTPTFDKTKAQTMTPCPAASGYAAENNWGTGVGSCAGTPEVYGITVMKMGLCKADPAPAAAGSAPDFTKCSLTFDGSETVSFAAGGAVELSKGERPDNGTYTHAVLLFEKTFEIQAEYGPLGNGNTWYSTSTYQTSATSGPAQTFEAPLNTFGLDTSPKTCKTTSSVSSSSGTMTGYILDSSLGLIADDSSSTTCTGATYLLGTVQLNAPIEITESTTECKANFTVTNNGTTMYYQNNGDEGCTNAAGCIAFDSGPFDIQFTVIE